jgi:hypothetical protein
MCGVIAIIVGWNQRTPAAVCLIPASVTPRLGIPERAAKW